MNHRGRLQSLRVDRVDSSPRDLHQDTCIKPIISKVLDGGHVAWRGGINLHRMVMIHRHLGI